MMRISVRDLRRLIREEFETAYNDYRAAEDDIIRRIRPIGPEDMKIKHPKFYSQVADGLHGADRSDEMRTTRWYLMKTSYNQDVPYAMLPSGDNRVVWWNKNTDSLLPCETDEIYHALVQFGDKTQSS